MTGYNMQIIINAPDSFDQLTNNEREKIIQELQEELSNKAERIKGFKEPLDDFDEWEQLGFENDEWN